MIHKIAATKARENFAEIINRVLYGEEEFIIEKQGKAAALITTINKNKVKTHNKKTKGTDFLQKIAKYQLKGAPKNLAREHDKYTWE